MKMIKILQMVSLFAVLIIAVSCKTSRPTGRTYPRSYPTDRYPDYPRGEYPVYRGDPNPGNLPPGQAKKVYGGKSARVYAPGQRKKYAYRYPLVVIRTPDIVIGRYTDGRYYYKNPDGLMYWKGYDERFYLDEKHLKDLEYDQKAYDDWKYKGKGNNGNNGNSGSSHGNGQGNQNNEKAKGKSKNKN